MSGLPYPFDFSFPNSAPGVVPTSLCSDPVPFAVAQGPPILGLYVLVSFEHVPAREIFSRPRSTASAKPP